jgi:hypothetical protein
MEIREISLFSINVQASSGSHPASYWKGAGGSVPGWNAAGCEAHLSPPSSVDAKMIEL